MTTTHTHPSKSKTNRTVRAYACRALVTSVIGLLLVLACAFGEVMPTSAVATVAASTPLGQQTVASAAPSLRCTGRPTRQNSRGRTSATGFQIDIVVDHGRTGRPTDDDGRRRGPLVVSCGPDNKILVLACTTTPSRRNPISYRDHYDRHSYDRDYGFDRDDGFDLEDINTRDWDTDRLDRLDDLDLRDLDDLYASQRNIRSTHTTRRIGDFDIDLAGLVTLSNRPGDTSRDSRDDDLYDLFPDGYLDHTTDRTTDRDLDREDRRTGVCRWVGRP